MAFGFLGDIVEGIGDVLLPKGTRGSTIGGAVGSLFGPAGTALGSQLGASVSSQIASGSRSQGAVSSPTPAQAPELAAETAQTSAQVMRAPDFGYYESRYPLTASIGPVARDIGMTVGGAVLEQGMDIIPDISISKFFGDDACAKKMPKLVGVTKDGCATVTRKQQRVLRQMLNYLPIEEVAYQAGVDVGVLGRLVGKTFPPRSRGITGSQLRTANRVNNKILSMAKRLGYDCKPMTTARRGAK